MRLVALMLLVLAACGPTMGDPCTTAKDCAGQQCLNGTSAPGGYCSKSCVVNDPSSCPRGTVCFAHGLAQDVPGCFLGCAKDSDCRTGYTCKVVEGASSPVCVSAT